MYNIFLFLLVLYALGCFVNVLIYFCSSSARKYFTLLDLTLFVFSSWISIKNIR